MQIKAFTPLLVKRTEPHISLDHHPELLKYNIMCDSLGRLNSRDPWQLSSLWGHCISWWDQPGSSMALKRRIQNLPTKVLGSQQVCTLHMAILFTPEVRTNYTCAQKAWLPPWTAALSAGDAPWCWHWRGSPETWQHFHPPNRLSFVS